MIGWTVSDINAAVGELPPRARASVDAMPVFKTGVAGMGGELAARPGSR